MIEMTPEQVKVDYIKKLGPELGAFFDALAKDVADIQLKFDQYEKLFGKQEHVDLLNSVAAPFFGGLQGILWEDMLLHLARLTDNTTTKGKENLTIRALPELYQNWLKWKEQSGEELADTRDFAESQDSLIKEAMKTTEFARKIRHTTIAHTDRNRALNPDAYPPPFTSREKVRTAIAAVHTVLYQISDSLCGVQLGDSLYPPKPDAMDLLDMLQLGVKEINARRERLLSGNPLPGGLGPFTINNA